MPEKVEAFLKDYAGLPDRVTEVAHAYLNGLEAGSNLRMAAKEKDEDKAECDPELPG